MPAAVRAKRIARNGTLALLLAPLLATADAGDLALGATPRQVEAAFPPFRCPAKTSGFDICAYFPPPETHRHLRAEGLETFAGFPVRTVSFTFVNGALQSESIGFWTGHAMRHELIDEKALLSALERKLGPPLERKRVTTTPRGAQEDLTIWERGEERWTYRRDATGGANSDLTREPKGAMPPR